jgi:hypothetical protein
MKKWDLIYYEPLLPKAFDISKEELSELKAWLKRRMERMDNGH